MSLVIAPEYLFARRISLDKRAYVSEWSASHRISAKGYLRAMCSGQVKLIICNWPNTGQTVANGTIPLQLGARNSTKTREQR
jgi:hypothetical protein